jgi:hypothetical protein
VSARAGTEKGSGRAVRSGASSNAREEYDNSNRFLFTQQSEQDTQTSAIVGLSAFTHLPKVLASLLVGKAGRDHFLDTRSSRLAQRPRG